MNSCEKVYLALEQLADADDDEIKESIPLPAPVPMVRGILPVIARQLPDDPADLDAFLLNLSEFCLSFRSDALELVAGDAS
jgi:hypothetical protein